jgi:hypothetical protein
LLGCEAPVGGRPIAGSGSPIDGSGSPIGGSDPALGAGSSTVCATATAGNPISTITAQLKRIGPSFTIAPPNRDNAGSPLRILVCSVSSRPTAVLESPRNAGGETESALYASSIEGDNPPVWRITPPPPLAKSASDFHSKSRTFTDEQSDRVAFTIPNLRCGRYRLRRQQQHLPECARRFRVSMRWLRWQET